MKAHIALQTTLLCCQVNDETYKTLEALAQAGRFRLNRVRRSEAGRTVGALCGAPGSSKAVVTVPAAMTEDPVLVLYQFTDAQMDALLAGMRSSGVSIPLKAAFTDTNKNWALCQLAVELGKEHAAIEGAQNVEG